MSMAHVAVMMDAAVYVYQPSLLPLLKQWAPRPVAYPRSEPAFSPSCDR